MKAMILAAGFGKRLGTLTQSKPKPMVFVNKIPMIGYSIRMLRQAGIKDVIINLHYFGAQIKKFLGDGRTLGVRIQYSWEKKILGTGGGIKKAKPLLGSQPFVVLNADVVCGLDLKKLIQFHKKNRALATMVVRKDVQVKKYGIIGVDVQSRVRRILDIGGAFTRARMFTGIHVISPQVFKFLPNGFSSIINQFYQPALQQGKKIMAYEFGGFWTDGGTKKGLQKAKTFKS